MIAQRILGLRNLRFSHVLNLSSFIVLFTLAGCGGGNGGGGASNITPQVTATPSPSSSPELTPTPTEDPAPTSPTPDPSASASPSPSVSPDPGAATEIIIEAENYTMESGTQPESTHAVGYFDADDWLQFTGVDFSSGAFTTVSLLVAVDDAFAGKTLELRLDSIDGELIAEHIVLPTGGWTTYEVQQANISAVDGVHDLYIVGAGGDGIANIDQIVFENGDPVAPPSLSAVQITPDSILMRPGSERQLSFVTLDQHGLAIALADEAQISWASDGGTFSSSNNTFTAGVGEGVYPITVTITLGDIVVSDSAEISVREIQQAEGNIVWAINAGGGTYEASTGVIYEADEGFEGGDTDQTSTVIKGTPDGVLYQTRRHGDGFSYAKVLDNGTYQVAFNMAEINGSTSSFDINIEGQTRIQDVDVIRGRDGRRDANYDLTIDNVVVEDGQLDIEFVGNATISALVVSEPLEVGSDWNLVWQDEFDVDGPIDSAKWSHENWAPGFVNDELQRYTDRTENSRVEDGVLVIEARRDFYMDDEFSSARIHSRAKGDLLYGRIEVRAKLPNGRGTWAAIWMMPTDFFTYASTCDNSTGWIAGCDAWPNSGEIDIMEHVGYDTGQVWATVHNLSYYWVNFEQRKGAIWEEGVDDDFHIYGIEWTPERIDIFKDDAIFFSYTNENTGWEAWPYDQPFHLILNLAVGGGWGGAQGVDDAIWPKRMEVDYVRMYQR